VAIKREVGIWHGYKLPPSRSVSVEWRGHSPSGNSCARWCERNKSVCRVCGGLGCYLVGLTGMRIVHTKKRTHCGTNGTEQGFRGSFQNDNPRGHPPDGGDRVTGGRLNRWGGGVVGSPEFSCKTQLGFEIIWERGLGERKKTMNGGSALKLGPRSLQH